jgi:membrane protein DedA with SNARE-associated domain
MAGILAGWIVAAISAAGYAGILLLMAIESACVPLPSEVIMPFAGYLVSTGRFDLWLAAAAGAVGCNVGSIPPYEIGRRGGRAAVRRYGRWLLLTERDVDRAERFFERFGAAAVVIGRLLPAVRSFIALPAGVAGMPRTRFHVCTFVGSFPWCLGLAWVGMVLGDNWRTDPRIHAAFRHADVAVVAVVLAGGAWFAISRFRGGRPR